MEELSTAKNGAPKS